MKEQHVAENRKWELSSRRNEKQFGNRSIANMKGLKLEGQMKITKNEEWKEQGKR